MKVKIPAIVGAIVVAVIVSTLVLQGSSTDVADFDAEKNEEEEIQIVDSQNVEPQTEENQEVFGPPETVESEIEKRYSEIEEKAEKYEYTPAPREWLTSGPFQIDRSQYLLGENIFIRMGELAAHEKGQIAFLRPLNDTHYSVYITIPFDGSKKGGFNQYFKPSLSKSQGICSKDDLVGSWRAVFQGTNYDNIHFEIIDRILPGDEEHYKPVC